MRLRRKKQPAKKPGNYAFIDSQNLNLGTQKMGWKMDWKKFREWLRDNYNVEKAFMFIGYMPDYEKLYDQLHEQGYLIVLKPTLEMFQSDERQDKPEAEAQQHKKHTGNAKPEDKKTAPKGNVDADLVLHVMKEQPNYSKAIIVSGDGDFYGLIEFLVSRDKLLHLMTPNWQYSSLLKPFDKHIIRLDQKRQVLRYPDFRRKRQQAGNQSTKSKKK